jgi:dihydrofolate reductase
MGVRKVIVSNLVSLDGLFARPNGSLDWHVVNDEFFEFALAQLNAVDTILFGRITYKGMVSYWTSPEAIKNDPIMSEKMNNLPKVVFSKTLDKAEWGKWNNARVAKGNIGDEVKKLKQQPGKDMVIFGSGEIVSALTELGLIDDYRLFVVPVILGNGKPMFNGITKTVKLKLAETKTFKTGVVMLSYELATQ